MVTMMENLDPYALEAYLEKTPAEGREDVLRGARRKHHKPDHYTLQDLKEEHALQLLLGRPLSEYPQHGRYELYSVHDDPYADDPLSFGYAADEERVVPYREADPALGGGAFDRYPTDGTLLGCLSQVLRWAKEEPYPGDDPATLGTIADGELRRAICGLRDGNPALVRSLSACPVGAPLFVLDPGLRFVIGWECAPDISMVVAFRPF